jgi:hypothetical protein
MATRVKRDLEHHLSKNHACYVLITCGEPKADGSMDVRMSYKGDAVLASYLLEGAQTYIHDSEIDT